MSKIKQSLPEDYSVLTGSELDGSPAIVDEPCAVDYAMRDLASAMIVLEQNRIDCFAYASELKELAGYLNDIVAYTEKPF